MTTVTPSAERAAWGSGDRAAVAKLASNKGRQSERAREREREELIPYL